MIKAALLGLICVVALGGNSNFSFTEALFPGELAPEESPVFVAEEVFIMNHAGSKEDASVGSERVVNVGGDSECRSSFNKKAIIFSEQDSRATVAGVGGEVAFRLAMVDGSFPNEDSICPAEVFGRSLATVFEEETKQNVLPDLYVGGLVDNANIGPELLPRRLGGQTVSLMRVDDRGEQPDGSNENESKLNCGQADQFLGGIRHAPLGLQVMAFVIFWVVFAFLGGLGIVYALNPDGSSIRLRRAVAGFACAGGCACILLAGFGLYVGDGGAFWGWLGF